MKVLNDCLMNALFSLQQPLFANAAGESSIDLMASGCRNTCSGDCSGSCAGDCEYSCAGDCENSSTGY